jgi:hypothetical protein
LSKRGEYRLYVACEADEDIPYIAKYTGEDHILIGSDYGHNDPSNEPLLLPHLRIFFVSPILPAKIRT